MSTGIDTTLLGLQNSLSLSQTLLSSLTNSTSSGNSSSIVGTLLTSLLNSQNSAQSALTSNLSMLGLNTAAMALDTSSPTSIFSTSTPNAATLTSAVNTFVTDFNNAVTAETAASGDSGTQGPFATLAANNATALQAIGITVNSDNTLSVNQTTLSNAITTNPQSVQNAFNSGSFAANVQSQAMTSVNQSVGLSGNSFLTMYNNSLNSYNLTSLLTSSMGLLYNGTL